ncbi:hypothetical protein [Bradyrhizobium sp. SUTN9-2]|uniref:hypothetical protein n=1 Tax=Bradyrhizobium yuanmingense TaxID=108015 RepID=UPI000D657703|nr:hypothetical protein [Bradyrhizobium sp. NBAIM20]MCA1466181.1 hypothetical protein [Bradyrhizobium sp. NBAIM18]MCA1530773.1 hypothetical protein [Bradyrhizobium yuanmingense]PWE75434.1 hypothetical protein XF30_00330 [Bradyrhizobium sp. SUTN9-2]
MRESALRDHRRFEFGTELIGDLAKLRRCSFCIELGDDEGEDDTAPGLPACGFRSMSPSIERTRYAGVGASLVN